MKLQIPLILAVGACVASSAAAPDNSAKIVEPQPVRVANTATDPAIVHVGSSSLLVVRDADEPARRAFHQQLHFEIPTGVPLSAGSLQIPPGKRLVIEDISADIRIEAGDHAFVQLSGTFGGNAVTHYFAPTNVTVPNSPVGHFVIPAGPQRLYYDEGQLGVLVNRTLGSTTGEVDVAISGHLVDVLTGTDASP